MGLGRGAALWLIISQNGSNFDRGYEIVKGSAMMNSVLNDSRYGILDSDRGRRMPTKIAMPGKKNIALARTTKGRKSFVSRLGSTVMCWPSTRSTRRLQRAIFSRGDSG